MRVLWRKGPEVKVPAKLQQHLALALWTRRANRKADREFAIKVTLERPSMPQWIYGLPLKDEVSGNMVSLPTFGLSLVEAKALDKHRAIRARNRELRDAALQVAQGQFEKDRLRDEFEQVRFTNDYRELFGLHPLAWDKRLWAACRQHADYLWESGEFGHEQPAAEFSTSRRRAQRAGYDQKVYENCHKGTNQPFDVLDALVHSSEHHRTMLREIVHEIATARSGLAWVQNYGLDTGFQSTIQWGAWRD